MSEANHPAQLDAIEQLGAQFLEVARRDRRLARSRSRWRAGIAVAAAALVIPGGYALAQELAGDPEGVPASECPAANAVVERYGLGPFERYIPDCPDPVELERSLEQRRDDLQLFPGIDRGGDRSRPRAGLASDRLALGAWRGT